jgi:hypothetical protein
MFRCACLVVTGDHYGALRAAGAYPAKFWWDCGLVFDQVAAAVFGSVLPAINLHPLEEPLV